MRAGKRHAPVPSAFSGGWKPTDAPRPPTRASKSCGADRSSRSAPLPPAGWPQRQPPLPGSTGSTAASFCQEPLDNYRPGCSSPLRSIPGSPTSILGDWAKLERSQRTRDMLHLMVGVIHSLWMNAGAKLLKMLRTRPVADVDLAPETTRYLEDRWLSALRPPTPRATRRLGWFPS